MSWFVVDVEADGPAPGLYSMLSFAAVRLDAALTTTFEATVAPISASFEPPRLALCGVSREEHLRYEPAEPVMERFAAWLATHSTDRPIFVSDNPAFDFAFINWYFHRFTASNPFGHSARRIGDLYAGMRRDCRRGGEWKSLRRTAHTHHPLDDAKGMAEALLAMAKQGLKPGWE